MPMCCHLAACCPHPQDRSDDEESDHTPDPYSQHMKGRVSPSPYTANTERARQFNVILQFINFMMHTSVIHISSFRLTCEASLNKSWTSLSPSHTNLGNSSLTSLQMPAPSSPSFHLVSVREYAHSLSLTGGPRRSKRSQ